MKFDFHTHCFPDKIAERAISTLASTINLTPFHNGSFKDLKELMVAQGVGGFAVMNIATNANQMQSVNDFAASMITENVVPFGSVYPDAPDALDELDRIKSLGLKGIKFHSEYQHFSVDEERMIPIYKKASKLGLAVLFHAGVDPSYPPPYHCTPVKMLNALKYLDTNVIAAHWGSAGMSDDVIKCLLDTDIYFDTSMGRDIISKDNALRIIEKHGTDKLLFASDSPWHSPNMETEFLESLCLSDSEKNDIYWNNAEKLLLKF